jgi:hypothetical protein
MVNPADYSFVVAQILLSTIAQSVVDVANASLVLLVVIFVYCLLGMQFFGGKFTDPSVRARFDTLYSSFLAVFQVLSIENWNDVVRGAMPSRGHSRSYPRPAPSQLFVVPPVS